MRGDAVMRVGVDVGGTKIEIVALAGDGAELLRRRVPTPVGDYAGTIACIVELVRDVEREVGRSLSVGVGTPGSTSAASALLKNSNSAHLRGKPLRDDLQRALEREIRMTNDANCLALSEAVDGAGADARVVFGVILGTGVGGGIAIDRVVHDGPNAIAGEWGHNELPWRSDDEIPGPPCYCGKGGCIETFLCGAAYAREASAQRYDDRLARALASVVNVLDPDVIVLGGGVSNVERLYDTVPMLLRRYVFSDTFVTPIVRAKHGDSSGVRGAAMLWQG